jgi:uncharacterized membrane protein YdjX (TVP38/TMEM64 family)
MRDPGIATSGPGKREPVLTRARPALTEVKRTRHGGSVKNPRSPLQFILLALVLVAGAAAGWWWLKVHDFNLRLSIDAGVGLLRDAGPWVFFSLFAVLPAFGFPISVFYLIAGSAFAERLGMGGVLAAAGAALLVNISLSYWLGRYALRPWLERWISRTKYRIPRIEANEHAEITLIVRITPGPPFFVQSYLLGLASVAFRTYLWISWTISMAYAAGFIIFGDAIMHGKGRLALLGITGLVAVGLGVHLLRKHYGKKGT